MSILNLFTKNEKNNAIEKLNIPGDIWMKCPQCGEVLFQKDLEKNFKVCLSCSYHFRISPEERIHYIFDRNTFVEMDQDIKPVDFLSFEDTEKYSNRIQKAQQKTGKNDAIMTGTIYLKKTKLNIGIMNFGFLGGSMGSVVGEKITRLIEQGAENKCPVVIFTASGGARMQEGIMSLMQMAKTSAALYKLQEAKVPYISVLCDPTTGGTSASFAMLGDLNIAEPDALISFAGPRVIEQTIRQKLPEGFQRSEFLQKHGMIDLVIHRKDMRQTLHQFITLLNPHYQKEG